MLEEGIGGMEKKVSSRPSPGQCKTNGPTNERKLEPNRGGFARRQYSNVGAKFQDVQTPRPTPVQKWDRSSGDRRQRERGSSGYRQSEKVVEQDDVYNVVSSGSRKGNANHLLKIKFNPRQSYADDGLWGQKNYFNPHKRSGYKRASLYKKEQFLQACCQFVVRDTRDYIDQALDPDALVDWKMVELIRSSSTVPVICPICLQPPSAGKMTKCGHTYCWPCILHFIKLGEADSGKCPICTKHMELDDLKSVQWIDVPDYKMGDDIEMRLMRKSKGSVFAVPRKQWFDQQGRHLGLEDGDNTKYMKLVTASCDQIRSAVIGPERRSLLALAESEEAEESELVFINMALEYLNLREGSLEQAFQDSVGDGDKKLIPGLGPLYKCQMKDPPPPSSPIEQNKNQDKQRSLLAASACLPSSPPVDDQVVTPSTEGTNKSTDIKQQQKTGPSFNTKDDYFFYQASTGQHIYLNSLNAQCLATEYGSLEASPDTITGTVVAMEQMFMTEDLRKRLRYLSHIPLTCEFHVVEVKLKEDVVSQETLDMFGASFEKKHRQRQQKAKEDRKRAKKYEIEQRKTYGIYPEIAIPLNDLEQFPANLSLVNAEEELNSAAESFPPVSLSPPGAAAYLSPVKEERFDRDRRVRNDSSTSDDSTNGSRSFAQMLRGGWDKTGPCVQTGAWGSGPSVQTGAWGCRPSSGPRPSPPTQPGQDEDSDGDSLPAPSYSESMSDAIARALDSFDLKQPPRGTGSANSAGGGGGGGGRKKRKEKKILLSTMARTN